MTNISQPIVFFGTEDFSLTTLCALIDAGYPVAAVVTKPDTPRGRGHTLTEPAVKSLAKLHNIPVWQPTQLSDIVHEIKALAQPIGVLVSYGKIIPQSVIDLFNPGIINVHPSLLPLYRGPSPIEATILNGDTQGGVSIMQLSAAMDAGPVYQQTPVTLNGNETAEQLYDSLGTLGAQLLVKALPAIANGDLTPTPQDNSSVSYCQLINKSDGIIDWNQPGATIERQIRAYHEWPQSRTTLGPLEVIITSADVFIPPLLQAAGSFEVTSQELIIYAKDSALRITAIKPLGKKEMPIQAFLSGYRSQVTN